MTGFLSGHPGLMSTGDLDSNIGPGVSRSDNEHCAALELRWIAIVVCGQLSDALVKIPSERRRPWSLIVGHGYHNVFSLEPLATGRYDKPVSFLCQGIHPDTVSNR